MAETGQKIALLGLLAFGCWEPGLTMLKWWATNDLRSRSGLHNIQFTGKGLTPYEGFRISEPSTVSETSNRTGIQLLNDVKSTSRFLHHLHVSVACQRSSTEWESLEKPIETPPGSQGPLKHPSLSPWLVDGDVVLTPLTPLTELGCQALICAVICLKPSIIGMTNQLVLVPIADSWSYGYRKRVKNLVPLHTFHAKLSGINSSDLRMLMPHQYSYCTSTASAPRRVARLASAKLAKASASAIATWADYKESQLFQWENHRNKSVLLQVWFPVVRG